ncbi:hypothetical protein PR202_gb20879 [Eleusine coracana subsp. coracana]|uniref:Uncharacterized protein n=1 Tax=Eleusine coracana subsp. coracana TaxID=191504 RepID=A0AAV5FBV6_ELECO|nr:hypothetical protein PR202_gb20879 [Eleusine coracana subsp. coracana]
MSRWKENSSPLHLHPRGTSNPSPLLPCKRPAQSPSPCPPPRRPLADVSGNALEQRSGGERCVYGSNTPLPKAPRPCGFLVEEDDDMDEAFLQEVDAICEEHTRSAASKDKEKKAAEGDRETVGGSLSASTLINDARPGLEDAFWEEVNAASEEHDARYAAQSQSQQGLKESDDEEEDSLVLSCDDVSLPPAISITADGGEPIDALYGNVDATIREGHAALCAAMDQEELQDIELEIEDKERSRKWKDVAESIDRSVRTGVDRFECSRSGDRRGCNRTRGRTMRAGRGGARPRARLGAGWGCVGHEGGWARVTGAKGS